MVYNENKFLESWFQLYGQLLFLYIGFAHVQCSSQKFFDFLHACRCSPAGSFSDGVGAMPLLMN